MKVSVIGLGLIGQERLRAIDELRVKHPELLLDKIYDANPGARASAAKTRGLGVAAASIQEVLAGRPDWVIVAVPHDAILDVSVPLLKSGTNVLVEKPPGRSVDECERLIRATTNDSQLYVGFNYRFYLGVSALLRDVSAGFFGRLISVNMTLGHGNSPGMEKSWKLNPVACGGGCLIDPGIHLLDLVNLISRDDVGCVSAVGWRGFWQTGIEEEAHLLLRDQAGCIYNVQASLNRWRSEFRIAVNGTDGYGVVEGRNRSYGAQSYRTGRRWGWQGGTSQVDSEVLQLRSDGDDSFAEELDAVMFGARERHSPCSAIEARENMQLLSECYAKLTYSGETARA